MLTSIGASAREGIDFQGRSDWAVSESSDELESSGPSEF
jgi:hypothetical protein